MDKVGHWDNVYSTKSVTEVSWFQMNPDLSLALLRGTHGVEQGEVSIEEKRAQGVIDVGGGASVLVDFLLADGFSHLAVLDISHEGLEKSKARLGEANAAQVEWIVEDITKFAPQRQFAAWHDRAVLHFLNEEADRARYMAALKAGLIIGGIAVIAAFAPDGPTKCSGLPIVQYDRDGMCALLGPSFALVHKQHESHTTPGGSVQSFNYFKFVKVSE